MGKLTLRGFRTVHGEQMLAQIAEQAKLGRSLSDIAKPFCLRLQTGQAPGNS